MLVLFSVRGGGRHGELGRRSVVAIYKSASRSRHRALWFVRCVGGEVVSFVYIYALYINFVMPRPASRMYSGALGARCV